MKLLFICNQNKHRSKTAELLFKEEFETKSAGLYNEKPVKEFQLKWADIILVMEDSQRAEIAKRFPSLYLQKRILSLKIPDIYSFNQPELIELLNEKMEETEELSLPKEIQPAQEQPYYLYVETTFQNSKLKNL